MLRDLKNLFVAISVNKVVVFETNLKSFVELLNSNGICQRNYQFYYREFKKLNVITTVSKDGCQYTLQKVL